jgi:hypothetical protein
MSLCDPPASGLGPCEEKQRLLLLSRGLDLLFLLQATTQERNAHRGEARGQGHQAWKASAHPISSVANDIQRVCSGRRGSGSSGGRIGGTGSRRQV